MCLNQAAPAVSATGVPDGNRINADHPAVVRIKVTNTGTAPEAYFVDGRTDAQTTYNLTALDSPDSVAPLTFADNIPDFLVPSQTTSITGRGRDHREPNRSSSTWAPRPVIPTWPRGRG